MARFLAAPAWFCIKRLMGQLLLSASSANVTDLSYVGISRFITHSKNSVNSLSRVFCPCAKNWAPARLRYIAGLEVVVQPHMHFSFEHQDFVLASLSHFLYQFVSKINNASFLLDINKL